MHDHLVLEDIHATKQIVLRLQNRFVRIVFLEMLVRTPIEGASVTP